MKVKISILISVAICILTSKATSEEAEDNNVDKTVEFLPLPVALLPNDTDVNISGTIDNSSSTNQEKIEEETADDCNGNLKGSFGCPCNTTNHCDASKSLECIDDTCYCMNSMHRMYDYDLEECVNLVGSPCSTDQGLKCIQNSECVLGFCKCNMGFSESSTQMCFLNAGQKCGARQCAAEKGLACKNELCQCLDSMYTYSVLVDSCVNPREMLRKFVNRIKTTAAEEIVDRKIGRVVNTGLNILTLPLKFIPFVG